MQILEAPSKVVRPARARTDGPSLRRFSVREYRRLHEEGFFGREERVELIEGSVVRMSPMGNPHIWVLGRVLRRFERHIAEDGPSVLSQIPLELGRGSMPEPDLMVLRDDMRRIRTPVGADALHVIEVSDTTLRYDLGTKARLYAAHRIPEYWVFDLAGLRLVIHRDPSPKGYRTLLQARPPEIVSPLAFPKLAVDLAEVFEGLGEK